MSKFRILTSDGERLSTAVPLKTGKLLQVYPEKCTFNGTEDWFFVWRDAGAASIRTSTVPRAASKPRPTLVSRLQREMIEFIDRDFLALVSRVTFTAHNVVSVLTKDGDTYIVHRSLNYFEPPTVFKNGKRVVVCDSQYSPALTSSKWFLMLAFITH